MSATCLHLPELAKLSPPRLSQCVHREECTQCFDGQDSPAGVDVCLECFNGGCLDEERHHARSHVAKTAHTFTLNVKRRPKQASPKRDNDCADGPPAKMAKLAIVEESEEDKFRKTTVLKCWKCDPQAGRELPGASSELRIQVLKSGIMTSLSSARQSEVKAWEEEITTCEHTLILEQTYIEKPIEPSGLAHCSECDLKENLWLCLTCGSLGCGRQQFGGLGGNGHGLQHYKETQHPVSVKLGTITPEGTADVFCYDCNDSKLDLELAAHLHNFGINVSTQKKTEKSMTELQIEQNLKYDFSLTDEAGKALEPVFGTGLTGLANLGNSCYMASVLQVLFSLPTFRSRYSISATQHWQACQEELPANCVECQMLKLADGLVSGRYSVPHTTPSHSPFEHASPAPVFQEGIRPAMFKSLIGRGHAEFATMRQQDAEEFLAHLLTLLRQRAKRYGLPSKQEPTEAFRFGLEQRLQCMECKCVRYRVDSQDVFSVPVPAKEVGKDANGKTIWEEVTLKHFVDLATADEALEYQCPACVKKVTATRRTQFSSFPDVLVIHVKKFQLLNWVPTKVDVPVIPPENDELTLDEYLGSGLQFGEVELPDDSIATPSEPALSEPVLLQLTAMGFPEICCKKALLATGNADAEAAMEWILVHMDDPDIDAPIPPTTEARGRTAAAHRYSEPSMGQVSMLVDMGFTHQQVKKALRETANDVERAVDWLFSHPDDVGEDLDAADSAGTPSTRHPGGNTIVPALFRLKAFISHKGPSLHSGHYVAHIKVADTQSRGECECEDAKRKGDEGKKGGDQEGLGWVLFNDEKVVKADEESVRQLKQLAYLYVFERVLV